MKRAACFSLLLLASLAPVHAGPAGWITSTPLEILSAGKWAAGSSGNDLVIVDRATGLARIGQRSGAGYTWSELATGVGGITTATTLRRAAGLDFLAVASVEWNAVQLTSPGQPPVTLTAPVIGPQALVRLSTGQLEGSVQEDIMAFSTLGNSASGEIHGGVTTAGVPLFQEPVTGLPEQPQALVLSPQTSQPVLVSLRAGVLRVDPLTRSGGIAAGGFDVTGPTPGLLWTASASALFTAAPGDTTVTRRLISTATIAAGQTRPSGVGAVVSFSLGSAIASLDTVPFTDPSAPDVNCLVAVRFAASPATIVLYRLAAGPPATATALVTLEASPGESMAAVVSHGSEFTALSGPGGRAQHWKRYAQPAPGAAPAVVASGSLPALRARGAQPNLFTFDLEPFVDEAARLLASRNEGDWTTAAAGAAPQKETDLGFLAGLGNPEPLALPPGAFVLGNQFLPSASAAGFGAIAALPRSAVTFSPAPGAYGALGASGTFEVSLSATPSTEEIRFRRSVDTSWQVYDPARPPSLTAAGTLLAITGDTATGTMSRIFSAVYTFGPLPPAVPAAAVDADLDGLSDAFERAFGLTEPNADADGDGINNLTEQNSGTDPLDPLSPAPNTTPELSLEFASSAPNDGQIHLTWPAGLTGFVLETSDDLINWEPVVPQPAGNSFSEAPAGGRKYYRLNRP